MLWGPVSDSQAQPKKSVSDGAHEKFQVPLGYSRSRKVAVQKAVPRHLTPLESQPRGNFLYVEHRNLIWPLTQSLPQAKPLRGKLKIKKAGNNKKYKR